MKRIFSLLLAVFMMVSLFALPAAADTNRSNGIIHNDHSSSHEDDLPAEKAESNDAGLYLTPTYTPSSYYRSSKYYSQLCNVTLTGNQRTDIVNVAASQIGYHEGNNDAGMSGTTSGTNNYTEYNYWYWDGAHNGGSPYAWCAVFITWCARQAKIGRNVIEGSSFAYPYSDDGFNVTFKSRGSYTPVAGDLIFFCWDGNNSSWDHVGIVRSVSGNNVTTIEGNTGNNCVESRTWSMSNSYIRGYGVPNYSGSSGGGGGSTNPQDPNNYPTPPNGTYLNVGDSGNYVKWLQACLCQLGYPVDVDGQFGNGTANALSNFQRAQGLTVDGGFGPECRSRIINLLSASIPTISTAYDPNGTKVTITTSTSGATIYYTTDGSNPTTSSKKYTGAFVLSGNTTVKAISTKPLRFNSGYRTLNVTVTKRTVTFKDWNGTVLKTQVVYQTGSATAPANPSRTGYTFTGWDKAFTNVQSDLTVTAKYTINSYTVTFKDWDGTILKTQSVNYGGAATAPANPTRAGYTFSGWDKAFNNVTANTVVTAMYTQNATPEPTVQPTAPIPENAPKIIVDTKTSQAGRNVTLNVSLENNPGIVSLTLHLNYDSRLVLVDVDDTELLPGQVHSPTMSNPYTLCWSNDLATENFTCNGSIVRLTFQIPEGTAVGEYPVTVSYDVHNFESYNCDQEEVEFAIVNGKIAVTNVIYGDVNGDGNVNNMDRLVLIRHLANWTDYPASVIYGGADVNADGSINNMDRLILIRHLAGWSGYETLPYSKSTVATIKGEQLKGENDPTIIIGNATASPGDLVSVNVDLANNPGITAMTLQVSFDEALTLVSINDTQLLPGQVHSPTMGNPYTLCWLNDLSLVNFDVNGTIVTLNFRVAENAEPGEYSINISYNLDNYDIFNADTEPVYFAVENGLITVVESEPEVYTVTFVDWNGNVIAAQNVEYGSAATAPEAPIREGYTFIGWDVDFTNVQSDLTVTAQYEINTYTVTYTINGELFTTQTYEYGAEITAPEYDVPEGHTFSGWDVPETMPAENITIDAALTVNTYTVTYTINGELFTTQAYEYGAEITAPEYDVPEGHTFSGWDVPETMPAENITIDAALTVNTYTVTYTINGELFTTQTYEYGAEITAPEYDVPEGHTFSGWDVPETMPAENITLDAALVINGYTVTFINWDGTVLKIDAVSYGSSATAPEAPIREGYTFIGWDVDFTNVQSDLTVTAQYEINTYTVTYTINGELFTTQTYEYGAEITAPEYDVPEGHTFSGWNIPGTMPAENITADALLTINMYTVTFIDGLTNEVILTVNVEHGTSALPPAAPTHTCYSFSEWIGDCSSITENTIITAEYTILGDSNEDGVHSAADAALILRYSMGLQQLEAIELLDVNGDGIVNIADATLIMRCALHLLSISD